MPPNGRRSTHLPLTAALALTVLSGVVYGISFPPLALRALAWVALVPLLVAIRRSSLLRAVCLGGLWAGVMTDVTSDCLPHAVVNYYHQGAAIGWLMLLGATVITMVPYYSTFAAAYWLLARRFASALPLLAAAAWVGVELARVKLLGGNPWAVSGYSQSGLLPLMQIADLAGVHGIGFLLAAVNAAFADLWVSRSGGVSARRAAGLGFASAAAAVALAAAYGGFRLATFSIDRPDVRPVKIAILQGNLDLGSQWREQMYGRNLDTYLRLTFEAIRDSKPQLVFWPESAMTFFLPDEPAYQSAIGRVLGLSGIELIAGGPRIVTNRDGTDSAYFNSTFLISPKGRIIAWQDKVKLLPFAEYFPLQSIGLLRRDFGRARQFTPGIPQAPLPSVAGRAGVVVCNEAMFPEPADERVTAGAEYLVNPANDSWFGALKYSLQAYDIIRLRSIEQRRYLIRASTDGPSAIIDPLGRVVAESPTFSRAWIADSIRPMRDTTVYHAVGDSFAVASGLIAFVACSWARRRGP